MRASELAATEGQTAWLIESLWLDEGVGVLGGSPKTCKSWLALEMATAIAGGQPCLGIYPVPRRGRVVVYMAEDAQPIVRQRLDALCAHHGLCLERLDLFAITADAVRLDLEADQRRLEATIANLRPRLLVLDPLVRLHRIDENSAGEVSVLLAFLRRLQRKYAMAVLLVHHSRKNGSATQPGQALRGSGDLHAFGDSNLYLRRVRDRLVLTFEHRAAAAPDPVDLVLVTGETPHLECVSDGGAKDDDGNLETAITDALREQAPLSAEALRRRLRVRGTRLRNTLNVLAGAGKIRRDKAGWRLLLDPSPPLR
ncbi:MAG: AAA family ATPase [Planctomycetota bacterium]|nr:AAA family ATPase [Planctomycetota bacterium]